jgi:hypothetical protein
VMDRRRNREERTAAYLPSLHLANQIFAKS